MSEWLSETGNGGSQHLSASFFYARDRGSTQPTGDMKCGNIAKTPRQGVGGVSLQTIRSRRDYLPAIWSETVSEARPFARRRDRTLRPSFVCILSRKPCLLMRRRFEGWKVLFILSSCSKLLLSITVAVETAAKTATEIYQLLIYLNFGVQNY